MISNNPNSGQYVDKNCTWVFSQHWGYGVRRQMKDGKKNTYLPKEKIAESVDPTSAY